MKYINRLSLILLSIAAVIGCAYWICRGLVALSNVSELLQLYAEVAKITSQMAVFGISVLLLVLKVIFFLLNLTHTKILRTDKYLIAFAVFNGIEAVLCLIFLCLGDYTLAIPFVSSIIVIVAVFLQKREPEVVKYEKSAPGGYGFDTYAERQQNKFLK